MSNNSDNIDIQLSPDVTSDSKPTPKVRKITKRDKLLKIIRDYNNSNPNDKQRKYSHLKVKELELLTDRLNSKSNTDNSNPTNISDSL